MSIEIKLAQEIGFCFGVRQAINTAKKQARQQSIYTLGALVHNDGVVNELAILGVKPVTKLADIEGGAVAVTAHGAPPEVIDQVKARGLELVDLTCPIVRVAQRTCHRLAHQGFQVIIFGDEGHSEVKGLLGWCTGRGFALLEQRMPPGALFKKLGIVSQTTQNRGAFLSFTHSFVTDNLGWKELQVVDTTCEFVQRRQAEATQLAQEVDVMLVIGSKTSANTKNLASLCSRYCIIHHVENGAELERLGKLNGRIGVCAGTSTPISAVNEVVAAIKNMV